MNTEYPPMVLWKLCCSIHGQNDETQKLIHYILYVHKTYIQNTLFLLSQRRTQVRLLSASCAVGVISFGVIATCAGVTSLPSEAGTGWSWWLGWRGGGAGGRRPAVRTRRETREQILCLAASSVRKTWSLRVGRWDRSLSLDWTARPTTAADWRSDVLGARGGA